VPSAKMLYRVTVKYIPLSGISSGDSLNLLENRVDFKLYAAEQHLNELKNIQLNHGTIMSTPEIRIKTEMEIDCFLASIMGALDSLLVQINRDLNLRIPIEDVRLNSINASLNIKNKGCLLTHLNTLKSNTKSWLWLLNEFRNQFLHRDRLSRLVRVGIFENINNNISTSDQTINFVSNIKTKDNPFLQKDIIVFFCESIDRMRELVDEIRKKLNN
jgi:hypothetical protein